jgi:ABC-type Na+ efflux pump permease subunit
VRGGETMKNILKVTSLLAVLVMLLVALTGCGGNKIVGTMEEDGNKSKIEMSFDKNDKLTKIVMTYEFKNKDDAKELYDSSKEEAKDTGIKVKKSGKKVTITMKAKDFSDKFGVEADQLDKETMKSFAKFMGYELKD